MKSKINTRPCSRQKNVISLIRKSVIKERFTELLEGGCLLASKDRHDDRRDEQSLYRDLLSQGHGLAPSDDGLIETSLSGRDFSCVRLFDSRVFDQ